jgi:hypothetical protein
MKNRNPHGSNIITTEWPLVTRSQLQSAINVQKFHTPDQINQRIMSLIMARKAIGDAVIACNAASHYYSDTDVGRRLSSIMEYLKLVTEYFPLTIKG